MRTDRCIAAACAVVLVCTGCLTPGKPKAKKAIGLDTSEVYRLASEALRPIADKFIERGDRVLLVPSEPFGGVASWRFVPVPSEIPQDVFEKEIRPRVSAAFKSGGDELSLTSPESRQLGLAFTLNSLKKAYAFKPKGDDYDEELLGRALFAAGYSGPGAFSLGEYSALNPYFVDSFESGLLSAVLAKQARGFERLRGTTPGSSAEYRRALVEGRLVFGTSALKAATWKELLEATKINPVQKMLVYSVDNVICPESGGIGFSVSFRLVDEGRGGRVLWSGTKTAASGDFPRESLPLLGAASLALPEKLASDRRAAIARSLRDQGVKTPASAVLVKIDDIPIFGTYPVTREDFIVENALESFFNAIPGLAVVDKLFKRQYKEPWQFAHSVQYVNPLRGGDYAEFPNYYGARFMIGYRVLWKGIQGVRKLEGDGDIGSHVLGIYVKMIDMGAGGRIVASDFIPVAEGDELRGDPLYRCYARTSAFAALGQALSDASALGPAVNAALVNRRMEIAGAYLDSGSAARPAFPALPSGTDQAKAMSSYFEAYRALRSVDDEPAKPVASSGSDGASGQAKEKPLKPSQERDYYISINLMQSWFEDGLVTALLDADANLYEKLESLYSRALVRLDDEPSTALLSPLLLSSWSATVKKYYNLDRIVYFSLMDTKAPESRHVKVPDDCALARYFPFVSFEPDSLQVSVVNVTSGDYEFKRDFPLE